MNLSSSHTLVGSTMAVKVRTNNIPGRDAWFVWIQNISIDFWEQISQLKQVFEFYRTVVQSAKSSKKKKLKDALVFYHHVFQFIVRA